MPKTRNIVVDKDEKEHSSSDSCEEFLGSIYDEELANKIYFNDHKRKIDFILVSDDYTLDTAKQQVYIYRYIKNLEQNGLEFEIETGAVLRDLIFIKIHAPNDVLLRYADAFKIRLEFRTYQRPIPSKRLFFKCMATDLTNPNPDGRIFYRAEETLSGERPLTITTIERIIIVETLLSHASFGNNDLEYGLGKLLDRKAFIAAYPLHDGTWKWTKKGPLNDRQLLANYWARLTLWYKEQPLNVIEKYYGPEVAFYFAFCGFYNTMLIPASIMGLICFFFGIMSVLFTDKQPIEELCSSTLPLCPMFFKERTWHPIPLNNFCLYTKLTYMFDNYATVFFALFMAFWATTFMELWKRQHAVLMYRWHLKSQYEDVSWSQEFADNTKYRRICPVTGNFEPYMPLWLQVFNYSVTCATLCAMIIIVLIAVIATIIFRLIFIELVPNSLLTMTCGATLNVIFIKIFGRWYGKISFWLTKKENPRTQSEFDDSYIYKIFLLSFVNNYAAMSYMGFLKGKFFTHPGDFQKTLFQNMLQGDVCQPSGCILALCIQLGFIMVLKSLVGNICVLFVPTLKAYYQQYIQRQRRRSTEPPQWEEDYNLKEMGRYFLVKEYSEMTLQYGLVTFFVAAFPLAPLCAFVNNMIELRTDANKFVRFCRRPVPVRIGGLQAWNGILQAMTFMSMVTNAFVVAFASDIVKREIYRHNVDPTLKGYINSTLSIFNTKDINPIIMGFRTVDNTTCYYRGDRYPPDDPNKYQLTAAYWYEQTARFIVAFIFEHVILVFTGILAYAVPDMPYALKKLIKIQREERKEERLKRVEQVGRRQNRNKPVF